MGASTPKKRPRSVSFSNRRVFITCRHRFCSWSEQPAFIAFDNGGGALMIPYVTALLAAGLTSSLTTLSVTVRVRLPAGFPPSEP